MGEGPRNARREVRNRTPTMNCTPTAPRRGEESHSEVAQRGVQIRLEEQLAPCCRSVDMRRQSALHCTERSCDRWATQYVTRRIVSPSAQGAGQYYGGLASCMQTSGGHVPVNMDAEKMPTLELRETFQRLPQAPCEGPRVPAPISHTLAQICGPRSMLVQVQSLAEGALD